MLPERTVIQLFVLNTDQEQPCGAATRTVLLPPAVIRAMLTMNPDDVLAAGWEGLMRDGPSPLLVQLYESLVSAGRRIAEALAQEDILALEQGTAIADKAQYVAHRQILQTALRGPRRRSFAEVLATMPDVGKDEDFIRKQRDSRGR